MSRKVPLGLCVFIYLGASSLPFSAVGQQPASSSLRPTWFIRGDAVPDKVVDLTDAIGILEFAILGTRPLGCLDAADFDGSLSLDLTDPILILRYLFLGDQPPPATPGPTECGPAPLGMSIGCADYDRCVSKPTKAFDSPTTY